MPAFGFCLLSDPLYPGGHSEWIYPGHCPSLSWMSVDVALCVSHLSATPCGLVVAKSSDAKRVEQKEEGLVIELKAS